MSIIARRIPSQLALAGAESCGPTQKWDPNYVFMGIKGQCVPASQPLVKMASDSSAWAGVSSVLTSLWGQKPAAPPVVPAYAPAAPAGMSTNTMIAIGLGAAGLLAIAMLTRK